MLGTASGCHDASLAAGPDAEPHVLRYRAFVPADSSGAVGGNPAGVVIGADGLDDAAMLAIADDVGYSETAFLTEEDDVARPRVRFFSPRAEVPFCGHATIAAAAALAERQGPNRLTFDTLAGPVVVTTEHVDGRFVATLVSPTTRSRPAGVHEVGEALKELRWSESDLDPALPVHVAFAGEHHLVVPSTSRERLAELDYDVEGLAAVMRRRAWTTVHLTWRERDDLWHARDPFPVGGVVEDPATGAAAAAFGGYLRALDFRPLPFRFEIHQGEDMGCPCRLVVDLPLGEERSHVSGAAVRS